MKYFIIFILIIICSCNNNSEQTTIKYEDERGFVHIDSISADSLVLRKEVYDQDKRIYMREINKSGEEPIIIGYLDIYIDSIEMTKDSIEFVVGAKYADSDKLWIHVHDLDSTGEIKENPEYIIDSDTLFYRHKIKRLTSERTIFAGRAVEVDERFKGDTIFLDYKASYRFKFGF